MKPRGFFRKGCVLLAILVLLAACGKQPAQTPKAGAEHFFNLLAGGAIEQAYGSASFAFQTKQTPRRFEATARELGLVGAKDLVWQREKAKGEDVELEGRIMVTTGQPLEFYVTLTREDNRWKVLSLQTRGSDPYEPRENRFTAVGKGYGFSDTSTWNLPPDAEVRKLVKTSLLDFAQAVQAKNFEAFYDTISMVWQSQISPKRLYSAFEVFIQNQVNFEDIRDLEPVFDDPPVINADGLLLVRGHYVRKADRLKFDLRYRYELPKWRLFSITLGIVANEPPTTSPEPATPTSENPK